MQLAAKQRCLKHIEYIRSRFCNRLAECTKAWERHSKKADKMQKKAAKTETDIKEIQEKLQEPDLTRYCKRIQ